MIWRYGIEAQSFEDFFSETKHRVLAAVFIATGNRELAEDSTQEAYLRAFTRWRRLRKAPWATGWVITTALNVAKRMGRRSRRITLRETIEIDRSPEAIGSLHFDLMDAIRALPYRQKEATLIYYLAELSVTETAEAMGISEGAVKSHLARARKSLSKKLEVEYVG